MLFRSPIRAPSGTHGANRRNCTVAIAGRVSMDLVTIFVGDDPVEIGDRVVLFGEGLPVEEVEEQAGTISYELLVGIGDRVPRVVQA